MSKTFNTRNLAYSALLIAFLGISAYISIPTPIGVAFTLQVLIIFVLSCLLEKKLAALTVFTYVLLGLVGAPIFSGGNSGFSYVFQPTFGYLIGFILGAFILSSIYSSKKIKSKLVAYIIGSIAAIAVIYLFGITYFYLIKNLYSNEPISLIAAFLGLSFPYIILDLIKCILAYGIIKILEKALKTNTVISQ